MTRAGGHFFDKRGIGFIQKRSLHYGPRQGHFKPGPEKIAIGAGQWDVFPVITP
jgi:hypothetical protein